MTGRAVVAWVVSVCAIICAATGATPVAAASCRDSHERTDAAVAQGDFVNLEASGISTWHACGTINEEAPAGPAPVLITSTDACDPTRASASASIVAACETLAATQIATCDPTLGYRFHATMIQTLRPDGTYTTPILNSVITCNTTPQTPPITVTEADFRTLPLAPSTITVGPPQGWIPVNMTTVAYTTPTPQTLTTTLLGHPVTIRATPTQFTWNWADDTPPTTTTDPGHPWPNHTISHTYTHAATHTVTMTTTWTGEYSLDAGTTYTPITGTATTTSTAPPLTIHELRTHLVEDLIN